MALCCSVVVTTLEGVPGRAVSHFQAGRENLKHFLPSVHTKYTFVEALHDIKSFIMWCDVNQVNLQRRVDRNLIYNPGKL